MINFHENDNSIVASASYDELVDLIDFALWQSPSTMIPSHDQVKEWVAILEQRGVQFLPLADICRAWTDS